MKTKGFMLGFKSAVALAIVGLLTFSILCFQNCAGYKAANVHLASLEQLASISRDLTIDPVTGYTVETVPALCSLKQPEKVIDLLKPVLATRNSACIMCHAQVSGDVVFDLGYGDPFFMGLDSAKNHPNQPNYGPFNSKHFVVDSGTWSASSVMGNLYVPDVSLVDSRLLNAYLGPLPGFPLPGDQVTLVDLIQGSIRDPYMKSNPTKLMNFLRPGDPGYSDISTPGLRGKVISRKDIWIDAPTSDEIRSLLSSTNVVSVYAGLGLTISKNSPSDTLFGLVAQESKRTHKLYAINSGTVTCRGDVIIDGTVFLNNLILATDSSGCRLYVTGTVFIQGSVTYANESNSNLQITSASAVIMGMRSLQPRLSQKGSPDQMSNANIVSGMRLAWTDDAELASNTKIYNDRDSIDGLTDDAGPWETIKDSSGNVLAYQPDYDNDIWILNNGVTEKPDPNNCDGCVFYWAQNFMRKSINYTHLVLNAPKIYNRYYGTFTGVIIGEDVLFAVDNFKFQSDPVFSSIKLLPLVGDRIFSMSDD